MIRNVATPRALVPPRTMGDLMPSLPPISFDMSYATLPDWLDGLPSIPTWVWAGGAALLLWWLFEHTGKKHALRSLESEYEQKRREIADRYSMRGRVRRGAKRAGHIAKKARRYVPKVSFGI